MNVRLALLVLALTVTACNSAAGPSPAASPPGPTATAGSTAPDGSPGPTEPATPAPTPSPSPTTSAGSIDPPQGDSQDLVLRIDMGGGLAGPDQNALTIPQVSIYADGRVISQGVQILIYPGPALPPLMLSRLSPAGLAQVLDAAAEAGLTGGDRHYPLRGIPDAHTTTFSVAVGGETHVVTVEALGIEAGHEDQLDATELQARQAMLEFQGSLTDLRSWLGTDVIADGLTYEFDELRVFARPGLPPEEPDLVQPDLEWPLSEPLASAGQPYPMGEDARCLTVSGDDLLTLLPLAMSANQLTLWESDGARYEVLFRPLLPDETGCPDA